MTPITGLVLVAIATAVAIVSRLARAPYTVALVVAGLAIGALGTLAVPALTKELLFGLFLPGLLFEAALHLSFAELRASGRTVALLALPGVLVSVFVIGGALFVAARALHLSPLSAGGAFVFAALIGATDPIAVVALFKQLHAPKRLAFIVEAESIFNDGTAVVFYTLATAWAGGEEPGALAAVVGFAKIVGGGAAIGALTALVVRFALGVSREPMIGVSLTTLAAYGSFTLAERAHVSGVIATVVAGMLVGEAARRGRSVSTATRVSIEAFWEYVAFALNSLVFLLIGFEVRLRELLASWALIAVAYVVVMLARALLVAGVVGALRRTSEALPWAWAKVIAWGGLRGALSMVLALSLPEAFPRRKEIVAMTYGVVLASLLLQGLTVRPLLRRLGLVQADA